MFIRCRPENRLNLLAALGLMVLCGQMWLQNSNGVYLRLKTRRQGLALSRGADGMVVRLGT